MTNAATACGICGRVMSDHENCGGDCVDCMARAGDPDCVEYVRKRDAAQNDGERRYDHAAVEGHPTEAGVTPGEARRVGSTDEVGGARSTAARTQRWVVYRTFHERQVFEGIEAASAEEAIAKFFDGEGELNQELTTFPEWTLEAERVG